MHTVFALLCFVVVIHWRFFPYPSGLLHWHCGNLTIAPVPAKQPWWIWINTSCEFNMNDCITTTKQSTTKPCAYFLGYTVHDSLHKVEIGSHVLPSQIQTSSEIFVSFLSLIRRADIYSRCKLGKLSTLRFFYPSHAPPVRARCKELLRNNVHLVPCGIKCREILEWNTLYPKQLDT